MSQDAKGCKMLQVSLTLFAGPIFNQIPLRPGTRQLPLHPLGTSSCDPHCRYLLWVPPRCLMSGMMISHPKRKNDKRCTVNNAHKTQEIVPSRFHQRNQIKQNPVTKTSREQEFRRNTKDASEKKWTSLICSNCHHPQTSKNACIYRILSINDGSNSAIWLRTHACFALKLLAFAIRALPTSWAQHPCIPHLIATSGLELEAHAKRSNEPTRKPPPLSITIRCLMGQDGQSGKHCLGRKFRGKKTPVQPPTSQILSQFCRAWRFPTGWDWMIRRPTFNKSLVWDLFPLLLLIRCLSQHDAIIGFHWLS